MEEKQAAELAEYLTVPSTVLPERIGGEEAVQQILALHAQNGGATFSLYFGSAFGKALYAVSVYNERSARVPGRTIPAALLRAFLNKNRGLLSDPRNNIGTWYNPMTDETFLDVSTTLPGLRRSGPAEPARQSLTCRPKRSACPCWSE